MSKHIPILLDPITDFLIQGIVDLPADAAPGIILDCTLGGGGHSSKILQKITENKLKNHKSTKHVLVGIDQDPEAITRNQIRFKEALNEGVIEIHHCSFSKAFEVAKNRPIYGILADLGISSDQIDSESRGFSFRYPAPLDMRMNPTQGESLNGFLQRTSETELADILWKYGEERQSRKIARRLISLRDQNQLPDTTLALAEAISQVFPPPLRFKRIHPATQSFQAFRIALNHELEQLETLISEVLPKVAPLGRIAILTFHSLEDRLVKHALRDQNRYDLPSRKAITPSEQEIQENPRSRSAKLRLAIRKKE